MLCKLKINWRGVVRTVFPNSGESLCVGSGWECLPRAGLRKCTYESAGGQEMGCAAHLRRTRDCGRGRTVELS